MPLRWDPLLARELARELDDRLNGTRLRALRLDGTSRHVALLFRETTLLWGLHPAGGFLRFLPAAEPTDSDVTMAARIRAVRAPPDERVIVFEMLPVRSAPPRDLVVELLGNQWNAIVAEGPDRRIRHVLVRRAGPRPMEIGGRYQPPPRSEREGVAEPVAPLRWATLLEPVPPTARPRELVARIAWTSSINVQALLGPDPEIGAGHALWAELAHSARPPEPVVLHLQKGEQPYPWPLPGVPSTPFPSLVAAFEATAAGMEPSGPSRVLLAPDVLEGLEAALDDWRRRSTRLRSELENAEDPSALRARGDLILARLRTIAPGTGQALLEGFDGATVRIEMDPAKTPQENAADHYARAAKAARVIERLPGLVSRAEAEVERLEDLLAQARAGQVDEDELRSLLPKRSPRRGVDSVDAAPYKTFRSSGGLEIRVGRSARLNDDLTFHHSAPDDVWMHARHAAGAHVILRWRGPGNPPARDLEEAAVLAALHSKARTSGRVPVDWTLRKYVRKPRKAPPGTVRMDRARTLFVEPDPRLLERLATPE